MTQDPRHLATREAFRAISRFVTEEDGLELLEWAVVAVSLVGLGAAYALFVTEGIDLVSITINALP